MSVYDHPAAPLSPRSLSPLGRGLGYGPYGHHYHYNHAHHEHYKGLHDEFTALQKHAAEQQKHIEKLEADFQEKAQEAAEAVKAKQLAMKEAAAARKACDEAEFLLENAEKECAHYKDLVDTRLKPAEAQNRKYRAMLESQKVAYSRLDKELSRLTHVEVDLNDAKMVCEELSVQISGLEKETEAANKAYFEEEKHRNQVESHRKAARQEAIEAFEECHTLGSERDAWQAKYNSALKAVEEAEREAEERKRESTDLRLSLEAAINNAHYVKEHCNAIEESHNELAVVNTDLTVSVNDAKEVARHAEKKMHESEEEAAQLKEELATVTGIASKLQEAYKVLQNDKSGMEKRLGAELAATLNKLQVCEAEKEQVLEKFQATTKRELRPASTSAFNELDRVLMSVDKTKLGLTNGETVRYEKIGDGIETSSFSLGSSAASDMAAKWAAKAAETKALCGQVTQELAYGTSY